MSMSPQEWAARVAEIGKLAGWPDAMTHRAKQAVPGLIATGALTAMAYGNSRATTAIRQLAADWLAAEGVRADIETRAETQTLVCHWRWDDDDCAWRGTCGVVWHCPEGTPTENGMHYCPRCSGALLQVEP